MVNKKLAFTLAESLICIAIISVFVVASAKVFTKRYKRPVFNAVHGTYYCYYDQVNNKYVSKLNNEEPIKNTDNCVFTPPRTASFYIIYAVGGGSAGSSTKGGNPGELMTTKVTSIVDSITIKPGHGGMYSSSSSATATTIVKTLSDNSEKTVMNAPSGSDINLISYSNVLSCIAYPLQALYLQTHNYDAFSKVSCEMRYGDKLNITSTLDESAVSNTTIDQGTEIEAFYQDYFDVAQKLATNNSVTLNDDFNTIWTISSSGKLCLSYYCYNPLTHLLWDEHNNKALSKERTNGKIEVGNLTNAPFVRSIQSGDNGYIVTRDVFSPYDSSKRLYRVFFTLTKPVGELVNEGEDCLASKFKESIYASNLYSTSLKVDKKDIYGTSYGCTATADKTKMDTDGAFVYAGTGGAKMANGYPGAVLIAW